MTRTTTWRMVALTGAAALALAACGDSGDDAGSSAAPKGDGTLTIGTLLPQTGSLAFLGPPEFAGVDLAAAEINAAGGVLGKDIVVVDGDSGDTKSNIAPQTVDRLLSENSDAIVGAASSSVTLNVIDKIIGAKVVQYSPANTSVKLSTYDDKGYYFRTAPADFFQGQVLADEVIDDGITTAAVVALQDAYGEGLAGTFQEKFTEQGGTLAPSKPIFYDPAAAGFEAEVGQVKAANPEAVVLIGFEESTKVIQEMIKQGVGPDKVKLYLVDGNLSNSAYTGFPAGIMEGTKGTTPGAKPSDEFRAALLKVDPKLTDFSYSAEAYDAVITIALAAEAAGSDAGEAIKDEIVGVTRDGEKCTTYADCLALLKDGKDIDYDGQSGPIDMWDNGEPGYASMGIYQYGADNKYNTVALKYVDGETPDKSQG
jgi:branched-chain amino acid transport system substrate-binding protein